MVDFEDRYLVSNDGFVVSLPRRCRNGSGERRVSLRLLKRRFLVQGGRLSGVVVKICNSEAEFNKNVTVASLMLEAFAGRPNDCVAHFKDGDPRNISISNLEWTTRAEIAAVAKNGGYWKTTEVQKKLAKLRKSRLKSILYSRFEGNKSALARMCKRSQSQMSNLLRDKATNGIGEALARDMETKLGLPHGWLDATHHGQCLPQTT